jgi:hypothetical protein
MKQEINPYEGVWFNTAVNKYTATLDKEVIGVFDSLEAACEARQRYIAYHASKRVMSYATAHSFRETRAHAS